MKNVYGGIYVCEYGEVDDFGCDVFVFELGDGVRVGEVGYVDICDNKIGLGLMI